MLICVKNTQDFGHPAAIAVTFLIGIRGGENPGRYRNLIKIAGEKGEARGRK
jgi:hypothetical protein